MGDSRSIRDSVVNGIVTGAEVLSLGVGAAHGAGLAAPTACTVDQTVGSTAQVQELDATTCAPWFERIAEQQQESALEQGAEWSKLQAERQMDEVADVPSAPESGFEAPPEFDAPELGGPGGPPVG